MATNRKAVAAVSAILIGGCAVLAAVMFPVGPLSQLPPGLTTIEELEAASGGGFMEACVRAAYRLEPGVAARIRVEGAGFLDTVGRPRGSGQSYRAWLPTPASSDVERPLGALSCPVGTELHGLRAALQAAGSHYSLSSNGEGMMVVDPTGQLAWYVYFG